MGSIRFIQDCWVRDAFKPWESLGQLRYLHSTVAGGVRYYVILWRQTNVEPWQKTRLSAREVRQVFAWV